MPLADLPRTEADADAEAAGPCTDRTEARSVTGRPALMDRKRSGGGRTNGGLARLPAAGCRRGANQRGPPAELVRRVMGAIVLRGRGVRGDAGEISSVEYAGEDLVSPHACANFP